MDSLLTKETKELVFGWGILHTAGESEGRPEQGAKGIVRAGNDFAKFAAAVAMSDDALQVLRAFGLNQLTSAGFAEELGLVAVRAKASPEFHEVVHRLVSPVSGPWAAMIGSANAVEKLTVPTELQSAEAPAEIVSLELRYREVDGVDLPTLAKAVELIETAYSAVAEIYPGDAHGQLKIIKIESGSSIRFDCRGLGEAVRHFKDFFLEAWHKFRHQKAEDLTVNNGAVLSSLSVLKELAKCEQSGNLAPEKAELLRRAVVESTLGLLQSGVLPAEVASVEIVDNVALLGQFNPKLLTDGGGVPVATETKKPRKRRRGPSASAV